MKERLRLLGHVPRMKDNRKLKIVLFGQPSRAKRKAGRPYIGLITLMYFSVRPYKDKTFAMFFFINRIERLLIIYENEDQRCLIT